MRGKTILHNLIRCPLLPRPRLCSFVTLRIRFMGMPVRFCAVCGRMQAQRGKRWIDVHTQGQMKKGGQP